MAYLVQSASQSYLLGNSSPIISEPVTISAWYKPVSTPTGTQALVSIGRSTGTDRITIGCNSFGVITNRVDTAGTNNGSPTEYLITGGQWLHVAGTVGLTGSAILCYANGYTEGGSSNPGTAIQFNRITIGTRLSSGVAASFSNGDIADVAVWNAVLSAEEIALLAKGIAARVIRPQNLVFYAPLIRDLIDFRNGIGLTNTNGATVSNHPRIVG